MRMGVGSIPTFGSMTEDGYKYLGKGLGTLAAALVCGALIVVTKGASGIGWFILALFLIW